MADILVIESSINGNNSFSSRLAASIAEKILETHPGSRIVKRNLAENPFPHVSAEHVAAFSTPPDQLSAEQLELVKHSDEAIREIQAADHIVIGVPMYNFGIPGHLKSWLNHIPRVGVTFSYAKGYPEGLLTDKKVYLAIATGGVYSTDAMRPKDFTEPYLRTVLGFMGMTDVTVFRTEGTSIPELRDAALPRALEEVEAFAFEEA